MSIDILNNESVLVRWSEPTVPNGIITGYEVNISVPGLGLNHTIVVEALLDVNITNLGKPTMPLNNGIVHYITNKISIVPYTPYVLSVAGYTSKGRGDAVETAFFTEEGGK